MPRFDSSALLGFLVFSPSGLFLTVSLTFLTPRFFPCPDLWLLGLHAPQLKAQTAALAAVGRAGLQESCGRSYQQTLVWERGLVLSVHLNKGPEEILVCDRREGLSSNHKGQANLSISACSGQEHSLLRGWEDGS